MAANVPEAGGNSAPASGDQCGNDTRLSDAAGDTNGKVTRLGGTTRQTNVDNTNVSNISSESGGKKSPSSVYQGVTKQLQNPW